MNVVLVSGVEQNDLVIFICTHICVIHIFIYAFFRFFSTIGYYKIWNIVPCAIQ